MPSDRTTYQPARRWFWLYVGLLLAMVALAAGAWLLVTRQNEQVPPEKSGAAAASEVSQPPKDFFDVGDPTAATTAAVKSFWDGVWIPALVGSISALITFILLLLGCRYLPWKIVLPLAQDLQRKFQDQAAPHVHRVASERASVEVVEGRNSVELRNTVSHLQTVTARLLETAHYLDSASEYFAAKSERSASTSIRQSESDSPEPETPAAAAPQSRRSPEKVLQDSYLALCGESFGDSFAEELQNGLRQRGLTASAFPVYRDASRAAAVFEDVQQGLANLSVSLRVEIGANSYLVPRPQRDGNFADLTGFDTGGATFMQATTNSLCSIAAARLKRCGTSAWEVTEQGELGFAV